MKINSLSLISLVAALTTGVSANAGAVADFYAGAMIGAGGYTIKVDDHSKSDSSMLLGAVVGVDIPVFRIEAEYNYLNSSKLTGNTAMVNAYFKMPSTLIMPYAGAGIGMMFGSEYESSVKKYDLDSVPAYQGMLGVTVDVPLLPFKFDVEGQVLYAPNVYDKDSVDVDLLDYNLRLKARYIF